MKVVLDIETVPAEMLEGSTKLKLWEKYVDSRKWYHDYMDLDNGDIDYEQARKDKAALVPEFAQIVCISILKFRNDSYSWKSFSGADEDKILRDFISNIATPNPITFIGHNIKGFDLPMIITRSLAQGITLHSNLKMYGVKPWDLRHIDTMEVWQSGLFKSNNYSSLESMCLTLGIDSPKGAMDGSGVYDLYLRGDYESIAKYCQGDCRATADAYLKLLSLGGL